MINLRDYQQKAVDAIRRAYAHKKRAPLLVLPTGGGKTTIFAYVTQQANLKNNCVFLLCHRAELVFGYLAPIGLILIVDIPNISLDFYLAICPAV